MLNSFFKQIFVFMHFDIIELMDLEHKYTRYKNIIKRIDNWPYYLYKKSIGFGDAFTFQVKGFTTIRVPKQMLGTFKESFFDGVYFKNLPDEVKKLEAPVVIDIGANVGFFSLAAFSRYPKAEVHAFEPHPFNFEVLQKYKDHYSSYKWNIYDMAISDSNGHIKLNTSTLDGFSTMTSTVANKAKHHSFEKKSVRLDTFLKDKNIKKVDYLKMDCEGSEYDILYALSKETFDMIQVICLETHLEKENNQNNKSMASFLKGHGFKLVRKEGSDHTGYIWAWK